MGLGPHAKRIYYKYIEKEVLAGRLRFHMLVDLASKKADIEEFCENEQIVPENIVLSDDPNQISPKKLDISIKTSLDRAVKAKLIQYAIVSTEPKAHKIYVEYFLKHKIPVLTDKPLTAPIGLNYDAGSAKQLYDDAKYLYGLSQKYKTYLYIMAQRREHPAYQFIFEEVRKVVTEYRLPITFFDIYHSDGTWSMPDEFSSRENHPYKYGYGKIMHSGYHFIDLVAWIAETNKLIVPNLYISNDTKLLKPQTHYRQIHGSGLYKKLFNKETTEPANVKMGEIDSYTTFTFKNGDFPINNENMVTYGHLDMLQSGFSKRAWHDLPKDTYKGNGRLRHEYINLNVGPLLNVQLHSYQADEINKGLKCGVGGEEHLDVYVFRNEKLIGGKSVEVIDFGSKMADEHPSDNLVYLGQNESSRYTIFQRLINNEPSNAVVQNQLLTNKILSYMFRSSISKSEKIFKA